MHVNERIGDDWSEPCDKTSHKKIVRIIVIETQQANDGSMQIILENPAAEEYIIINRCPFNLEVRKHNNQKRKAIDKDPFIVPKEKENARDDQLKGKVFVWDARDVTDHQIHI